MIKKFNDYLNKSEESWNIIEKLPINVNVKKSWTGKYYTIDVPAMKIKYETFLKIGDNLSQKSIDYGRKMYNYKYTDEQLNYSNDVTVSHYDYKTGECNFTASTIKDVKNWLNFYHDIVISDDYILNEGSETSPSAGSGTAVGGGYTGSFTSAMGVSVNGGTSGTAFSTNSNTSGMGSIVSPQPSSTPGAVWAADSKKGSGDVSKSLGPFTKLEPKGEKKRKKSKRNRKYSKRGRTLDQYTAVKFTEKTKNEKMIIKFNDYLVNETNNETKTQMVICEKCNNEFDMLSVPESGMGYVKCPKCGAVVTQI